MVTKQPVGRSKMNDAAYKSHTIKLVPSTKNDFEKHAKPEEKFSEFVRTAIRNELADRAKGGGRSKSVEGKEIVDQLDELVKSLEVFSAKQKESGAGGAGASEKAALKQHEERLKNIESLLAKQKEDVALMSILSVFGRVDELKSAIENSYLVKDKPQWFEGAMAVLARIEKVIR